MYFTPSEAKRAFNAEFADSYAMTNRQYRGDVQSFIDFAQLRPGEHVLDLGCGTGWVAMEAQKRVGSTGQIIGVDISDHMLNVARADPKLQALENVFFYQSDMTTMKGLESFQCGPDYPGFDAILSLRGWSTISVEYQRATLQLLGKFLKQTGRMILDRPHPKEIPAFWERWATTTQSPLDEAVETRLLVGSDVWDECAEAFRAVVDGTILQVKLIEPLRGPSIVESASDAWSRQLDLEIQLRWDFINHHLQTRVEYELALRQKKVAQWSNDTKVWRGEWAAHRSAHVIAMLWLSSQRR